MKKPKMAPIERTRIAIVEPPEQKAQSRLDECDVRNRDSDETSGRDQACDLFEQRFGVPNVFDHVAQNRAVEATLPERRASCVLKVEIHHGHAALGRHEKRFAVYVNSDYALTMFPTERLGEAARIAANIQDRRRTSARNIGDGVEQHRIFKVVSGNRFAS